MPSTELPNYGTTLDDVLEALIEYPRMWGEDELPEGEDPRQGLGVLLGVLHARIDAQKEFSLKARVYDLLDEILGLQLGTEMFGPLDVVLKSPFAEYVIQELESLAKDVDWTNEGYWHWKASHE